MISSRRPADAAPGDGVRRPLRARGDDPAHRHRGRREGPAPSASCCALSASHATRASRCTTTTWITSAASSAMKEVLPLVVDDPSTVDRPLTELDVIQPALVVPESRRIGDLFNEMRRDRTAHGHRDRRVRRHGRAGHHGGVGRGGGGPADRRMGERTAAGVDRWKAACTSIDAQTRVDEVNEALRAGPAHLARLRDRRRLPALPDPPHPEAGRRHPVRRTCAFTIAKMVGPKIERVRVERV